MKYPEVARLMAELYFDQNSARSALIQAGFPAHAMTAFTDASSFWSTSILQMEMGLGPPEVISTLIAATAKMFAGNAEAQALHAKWNGARQSSTSAKPDGPHPTLTLINANLPDEFLQIIRERLGSNMPDSPTSSGPNPAQSAPAAPAPRDVPTGESRGEPPTVLVLATEWFSVHGGLSTLNRRLCRALADAGAEVYCVVLGSSERERQDATSGGVRLVDAALLAGAGEQETLSRRPRLPAGVVPDLIVGHGRITGRAAAAVAHDHFEGVPRLHILHMAPDETEWLKLDRGNDAGSNAERRMGQERALLRPPAIGAGIGPRLHDLVQAEVAAFPSARDPVRIDPGFDVAQQAPRTPPRGRPARVLLIGRMEDRLVKGVDIAARALAEASDLLGVDAARLELVVRGVPGHEFTDFRDAVHEWAGRRSLRVTPRSYTVDSEELEQDLLRATLLLMPSRAEGFGLVGVEAIVAGTPVLVSDASGLGDLLGEVLPHDDAARMVVPVTGDDERDRRRWGAAIAAVLRDPASAFAHAERVRHILGKERPWSMAADAVLRAIR